MLGATEGVTVDVTPSSLPLVPFVCMLRRDHLTFLVAAIDMHCRSGTTVRSAPGVAGANFLGALMARTAHCHSDAESGLTLYS